MFSNVKDDIVYMGALTASTQNETGAVTSVNGQTGDVVITADSLGIGAAAETNAGIVELASDSETRAGTSGTIAITPAGLKSVTDVINGDISTLTTDVEELGNIQNGLVNTVGSKNDLPDNTKTVCQNVALVDNTVQGLDVMVETNTSDIQTLAINQGDLNDLPDSLKSVCENIGAQASVQGSLFSISGTSSRTTLTTTAEQVSIPATYSLASNPSNMFSIEANTVTCLRAGTVEIVREVNLTANRNQNISYDLYQNDIIPNASFLAFQQKIISGNTTHIVLRWVVDVQANDTLKVYGKASSATITLAYADIFTTLRYVR